MAREITILEVIPNDVGDQIVRFAMWFYPPVANQVPKPGASSSWRGASATDTTNIQSGAIVEEVRTTTFNNNMTLAAFKTYLQNVYTARANTLNSQPNPNSYYGQFFDGAIWSF